MSKQEDIWEGIRYQIAKGGIYDTMVWNVVEYLHSQGVVIKVDKDLPPLIDRFRGQVKRVLIQAGFTATEPLIKEEDDEKAYFGSR